MAFRIYPARSTEPDRAASEVIEWERKHRVAHFVNQTRIFDNIEAVHKAIHTLSNTVFRSKSAEDHEILAGITRLHHLLVSLGRRRNMLGKEKWQRWFSERGIPSVYEKEDQWLVQHMLDISLTHQWQELEMLDTFNRLPIHWAATYGMLQVCHEYSLWSSALLIEEYFPVFTASHAILTKDIEERTPLDLAVIGNYPRVVSALLEVCCKELVVTEDREMQNALGRALLIAVRSNFIEIVEILLMYLTSINFGVTNGETALFIAAKYGHESCLKVLLA